MAAVAVTVPSLPSVGFSSDSPSSRSMPKSSSFDSFDASPFEFHSLMAPARAQTDLDVKRLLRFRRFGRIDFVELYMTGDFVARQLDRAREV